MYVSDQTKQNYYTVKKTAKKLLAAAALLHNTLTEGKAENGLVSAMTIMLASGILTSEK